ncbi:hypothetical protein FF125_11210 [Aureibaculum algae]|uniref:Toxin-antitoxin system YwqK family antitoxin n=1 Tax=Aureibaculum algae TaxID=2584122 RepID=A0A5B7TQC2_9FLAO|nr:hypothetical protein [Aureibaculum algae]QCX38975.1 hypothetical protein FF125_11210 [Aureibaculum algae]
MYKLIILTLVNLCFISNSYAQKSKKTVIKDPVYGKIKIVKIYNSDGNFWREMKTYKHNKREYKEDKVYYHGTKMIQSIDHRIDGKKEGVQYWYYKNGAVLSEINCVNGRWFGPFKRYHENKQLREKGYYNKNAKLEKEYIRYNEDGKWIEKLEYLNGYISTGVTRDFNLRGDLIEKCTYSAAYKDCEERSYANDDTHDYGAYEYKTTIINYRTNRSGLRNYRRHGPYKDFFDDGTLKKEGTYIEDEISGIWTTYDKKGRELYKCDYSNDTLVTCINKRYKEKLTYESIAINGSLEGPFTSYYENGNIKEKGTYKKDEYHGIVSKYNEEGKIETEVEYADGKMLLANIFFTNGQIHRKVSFKNEMPYNVLECYNKKGKRITSGSLKNGSGTLILYDLKTGAYKETTKL